MINNCGIVDVINKKTKKPKSDALINRIVDKAYNIYKKRGDESSPHEPAAKQFRDSFGHPNSDTSITFMGLWDTVGAHGLPSYEIGSGFRYLEFYDQIVSSNINSVYQAVAVHENLAFFEPCHVFSSKGAKNVVEERFFPGVHIDIGGFVDDNPVSDATLEWMIGNINNATVAIDGAAVPTIGAPIPEHQISNYPPGAIVEAVRRVLMIANIFRPVFRDRVLPVLAQDRVNILYNRGNGWKAIARSRDYRSQAYYHFLESLDSLGIARPPPF